jgi:hypothetical protein
MNTKNHACGYWQRHGWTVFSKPTRRTFVKRNLPNRHILRRNLSFASYLCSFEFMQKGTYTFAVDRGDEKSRRSVLNLEMDHKGEDLLTIRVGGNAVMVAEGTMNIPDL